MTFRLLLSLPFSLLTFSSYIHGFEIINSSISPNKSSQIGSTVTLNCRTDSKYKFCKWWFEGHENKKYCNFEKKSNLNKIIQNECTLRDRIKVEETHDFNDCTIVLLNIQLSDSGRWTCRMKDQRFSEEKTLYLKVLSSPENVEVLSNQEINEIIAMGLFILGFVVLITGLTVLILIRNRDNKNASPPDSAQTILSYVF